MQLTVRELAVLFGLAVSFFIAFLIQPEWSLTEAHMSCRGEPVKIFDSMDACNVDMRPGCPCERPDNPWAYIFWLAVLPILGVAASISLRSKFLPAAVLLSVVLAGAGSCALFALSRREFFDEEAWVVGRIVVEAYIVFILVTFGVGRAVRHWILARRSG